ncbi:MAG: MFS transporter [Dehalococcoidia bacterium]
MDQPPQPIPSDAAIARFVAQRLPFFYGWVIVFVSFLCVFIMGATTFWALPVFVGPMHEDTGWSHTVIFLGLSANFMATGFGGLIFGRFTDLKGGASKLLLVGLIVDVLALSSLRWVQEPWQFILLYGIVGGLGGTSIRLVQATLISKWFVARRGTAIGVASNGGSISALVMVPLIAQLINAFGWRDAWSILGVIALLVILPLVPLVVRAPEDLGLQPDNGYQPPAGRRNAAVERSYRLSEVMRTGSFWVLLFGVLVGNYSLQAHTVVMVPHLEDIGYSSAEAATALSAYGFFSLFMRFVWGNLADARGVRMAIVAQSALSAVGAFLLMQVGGVLSLYLIIAFQGLMMSGYPPLQIMVWPEFFGRTHIGSIVGLTQPFTVIAGALAPVITGALFDQTGSYHAALWMLVGTWLLCSTVMIVVRPGGRSSPVVVAAAES